MAEHRETVPSWDGQARSWRRYTKEVAWFVASTPVNKRRYVASKLIGRLGGPARLLAMSWNRNEFDSGDGTLLLLRRLASSPLVRKTLPNTAAIMQQYLGFKRRPGEGMATFLVRETLGYEEFAEALMRLWEEHTGVDPLAGDFGLPRDEARDSWSQWYGYGDWHDYDYDPTSTTPEPHPDQDLRHDQAEDGATAERPEGQASPASAPSGPRNVQQAPSVASAEAQTGGVTEMALADSFIMQVLRGWRLLQAASLSPEETRDILSTTQNRMSFEAISEALQTLWDEQLLGQRYRPWHGQLNLHEWDQAWQDEEDWYMDEHYDDFSTHQDWSWHDADEWPAEEELSEQVPIEDEKLKEAYQAEKVAEQLAMEAKRTWAEAQRTTQQMKRDRGFGQLAASSTSIKCFNCGGNHYARDCPDRRHPSYPGGKSAGKGKFAHRVDYGNALFQSKGKGKKGKTKSKQANWTEWPEALWLSSKSKGKGKPMSERPAVNVYSMDYDFAGLEMEALSGDKSALPVTSEGLASSTQSTSMKQSEGMLDCGATASAAPDIAVQGLIKAVLSQDSEARIDVEYMRPFFRFGNGKWGQALYRVKITSHVSGQPRCFSLFSLPNPDVMHEKNLVPILVGMDHLGVHGCQMLVDFGTGMVMDGIDPSQETYQLNINSKGHLVYDILYHLTRGKSNHGGHATIHVITSALEKEATYLQFQPLEFYVHEHVTSGVLIGSRGEREKLLRRLYAVSRGNTMAQMQAISTSDDVAEESLRDQLRHGSKDLSVGGGEGHLGPDRRHGQEELQEGTSSAGQGTSGGNGSTRSSSDRLLAMPRQAHDGHLASQHARPVESLLGVQPSPELCASHGISSGNHADMPSGHSEAGNGGARALMQTSHSTHREGHDEQDQRRHLPGERAQGGKEQESHRSQGQGQDEESSKLVRRVQFSTSQFEQLGECNDVTSGTRAERAPHGGRAGEADDLVARKASSTEHFHEPRRGIRGGADRGPVKKQQGAMGSFVHPLPVAMAHMVMQLATLMTGQLQDLAVEIALDDRDGLWEITCSSNSWLSACALEHGLTARRINFQSGFDIYKDDTWQRLRELRRQRRPQRLWFSVPCTKWCRWTSVTYTIRLRRRKL